MNTSNPPPPPPPPPLPSNFTAAAHVLLVPHPKPRARRRPDLGPPKATPPCTECGKRFSSWKALFGHMRCHPERQWRGINPPPHFRRGHFSDRHLFTDDELHVAASLLLLSNSPPAASAEPSDAAFWRLHHPRFHFGSHSPPSPSSRSYFLDLNLPPPAEGGEGCCGPALDLKLGV